MRTILVVDDEAAARYGMRRALEASTRLWRLVGGAAREALAAERRI